MKLIIDIPDHVYEWVENTGKLGMYRIDTAKVIQNGIPLEEVRTEIEKKYRDAEFMNEFIDGCNHTIGEVLEILDNIGKGDSECSD